MLRYKVGDKVRIKKSLENLEEGGFGAEESDIWINGDMIDFAGKETVIVSLLGEELDYDYTVLIDNGENVWVDAMLEDIIGTSTNETDPKGYKDLATLLAKEFRAIDGDRYDEIMYFVTELRPDLAKLAL